MPFYLFIGLGLALSPEKAIHSMTGCFEVTFQYKEIEAFQDGYILAAPKKSSVIEWITATNSSDGHISLQHVLVTGPMIRHWRQEWAYEPRELFSYVDVDKWERQLLFPSQVAGNWAQAVTNVDDSPRYECQSRWQEDEVSTFWTCKTLSPIPRRDSKRSDYTILERTNTHRIIENGWVHEQENIKFSMVNGERKDLVLEQGRNHYTRINEEACTKAVEWWPSQAVAWEGIIDAWQDTKTSSDVISLKDKHIGLPLWIRLFIIARMNQNASSPMETHEKSKKIINHYIQVEESG